MCCCRKPLPPRRSRKTLRASAGFRALRARLWLLPARASPIVPTLCTARFLRSTGRSSPGSASGRSSGRSPHFIMSRAWSNAWRFLPSRCEDVAASRRHPGQLSHRHEIRLKVHLLCARVGASCRRSCRSSFLSRLRGATFNASALSSIAARFSFSGAALSLRSYHAVFNRLSKGWSLSRNAA